MLSGRELAELTETLLERAGVEFSVSVRGDPMKLRAVVTIERHRGAETEIDAPRVLEILKSAGFVILSDLSERVEKALKEKTESKPQEVARGVAPQVGESAKPDWKIELEKKEETRIIGDHADFHERDLIVQVKAGDVLFETIPPTRGKAGTDVYGQEIPGLLGDPKPLDVGDNVEYDAQTGIAKAALSGQIVFAGGTLSVQPVFRVEGDVDFNTGNIDFDGEVVVTGSVQDGFRVKASKRIIVHGSVFAATLIAGGDVTIYEGATMREKGLIECGGRLMVKYLNHAIVRAGRDVIVSSEIINSVVRTAGKLLIMKGNVYGGTVVALAGMEARQLGSPMLVPTKVVVGIDPDAQKQAEDLAKELRELERGAERIVNAIRPYVESPEQVLLVPEARRGIIVNQLQELVAIRRRFQAIKSELSVLGGGVPPKDPRIRVFKKVYPKVTMTIGKVTTEYEVESGGPMNLLADERAGRIINKVE